MNTSDKSDKNVTLSDLSLEKATSNNGLNSAQLGLHLFISDLHLCATRPHITTAFLSFLQSIATQAQTLYILGDLFEYWAGDDDIEDTFHQQIINAFRALATSGVAIFLMHGNRDFLITQTFCNAAGVSLIEDPSIIELHGKRILLSHGDDLCTDDVTYQAFRLQVRDKQWQAQFLSQPLEARKEQIASIRNRSEQEKSRKSAMIMDVNADAVSALLERYNYPDILIHGHTHRPNKHTIQIAGHRTVRWVLGDWYEQGSYLAYNEQGCHAIQL